MPERFESPGTPIGGTPLSAVIIGASAGGPQAIVSVLAELPRSFPAPIAVCQHMTAGATEMWAERLDNQCRLKVVEAQQGARFLPGHVYVAPTGRHMRIRGSVRDPFISLERDFADVLHVPSIDFLMSSAAELFGSLTMGVLLTGMGSDGALGMLAIRRAGGVTLVQPAETAFMPSMPQAATEAGAAGELVPLERMAAVIESRVAGRF